jgi:hypothetical protein
MQQRSRRHAIHRSVLLLLENLNKEPPDAEVHYLAHTIDEWRWFYENLDSPALQLSFTANHAHLVPEGVQGFIDAMPLPRVPEFRLAGCFRNCREEHLIPVKATSIFRRYSKLWRENSIPATT